MKIETEIRTVHTLTLTNAETKTLDDACEILHKLVRIFGKDTTLMSLGTGEIIQIEDLPLMCGTLSGIAENIMWTEIE